MKTEIVKASEWNNWQTHCRHEKKHRHKYRARLEGRAVIVEDENGEPVDVQFAGTTDNRTVYAYVKGQGGFIGGWQYPHKALPFRCLVESINKGIWYPNMDDLPKRSTVKVCPHCGETF